MAGGAVLAQGLMEFLWWDPVHLLQAHVVLHQDASDSGDADSIYDFDHLPIFRFTLTPSRLSGQLPSKSGHGWCQHPPKLLSCHPKYWFLQVLLDHICLPPLLALAASRLAKFSKWLRWGLFVAGWLVISFVSQYFQLCSSDQSVLYFD